MYKNTLLLMVTALFLSCASIPNSTSKLTKNVIDEGDAMHQLNISLINQLFNEKRARLNTFITNKYTPAIIKKYQNLLPQDLDYKKELPNIIEAIIPVINRKRDSLQDLLLNQQQKIVSGLNTNFISYSKATSSLQNLINSAVKEKNAEQSALSEINNLTGNKLNFKQVENKLDSLLNKTGLGMGKLLNIEKIIK
ncbi:hypothetical protein [Polaribacter sp. Hel1_85]|uniref:hypothetical protein n=1 Tax=Polaribacter sp. Hel1_85 TaxID=1250005 RepID=UPI00052C516D|nr:hypothetical protein [Polaribacter sp. Hel1_85]KGL62380.1 hypothetical protein PHEL85_2174 [Polaribacter sp. Hel1_85]